MLSARLDRIELRLRKDPARAFRHHAVRVRHRDHVVRRHALRTMRRRGPDVIDVPQPVIVQHRLQPPPVGKPDAQARPLDLLPDLLDPSTFAIHHPEAPEVAREEDFVPRSQTAG